MDKHPDADTLTRFLLERSGVRGIVVHLDDAWQRIAGRAHYPAEVAARLGETCAAAALFTGHAKINGRLSVQLRGTGALRTLFAECTAQDTVRGIAWSMLVRTSTAPWVPLALEHAAAGDEDGVVTHLGWSLMGRGF